MIYTTKGGEPLVLIADRLTLSPFYASALQRMNPASEELNQTAPDMPLPAGVPVFIPDDWLRPEWRNAIAQGRGLEIVVTGGTLPEVVVTAPRPFPTWAIVAAVAVLFLVAGDARGRR